VSELTTLTAPSRPLAAPLFTLHASCALLVSILLIIFYQRKINRPFRLGLYFFALLHFISGVGYTLFPLSNQWYGGAPQDIAHVIVTLLVVLLSLIALTLLARGFFHPKTFPKWGVFTLITLTLIIIGAGSNLFLPAQYFGLTGRLTIYPLIIYPAALAVFTFRLRSPPKSS
jgi:hypothetical protein